MNLFEWMKAKIEQHKNSLGELIECNRHMHNYFDEQKPLGEVSMKLHIFLWHTFEDDVTNRTAEEWRIKQAGETKIIDLLNMLTANAKTFRTRPSDIDWDQDCTDAHLTLFINAVAADCGVDYALYARDLRE